MNKKQIEIFKTIIKEEENNFDFNDYIFNYIDEEDLKDVDPTELDEDFFYDLNDNGGITNAEVIYYDNAIDYLKENDASLNQSLELALDLGYELKNINSELLASLLKSQNNEEDYSVFIENVLLRMGEVLE